MIRGRAVLGFAGAATLLSACGGQVRFGDFSDPDYDAALGAWTVKGKTFRGLDEQVRYAGTFLSPQFRQAYARRRAVVLGYSPTAYQQLMATQMAEAQREMDFVFGMYTDSPRANDLSSSHSIWRVVLYGPEGVERSNPEIKRTHPPNADQLAFFPYLETTWVFYSIRFPAVDAQGQPLFAIQPGTWTLRIASALGTEDLAFRLPPP